VGSHWACEPGQAVDRLWVAQQGQLQQQQQQAAASAQQQQDAAKRQPSDPLALFDGEAGPPAAARGYAVSLGTEQCDKSGTP